MKDILLDGRDEWDDIEKLLGTMFDDLEDISLPPAWSKRLCLAMLCVISCARMAFMKALGNLPPGGEAEMLQLRAENAELRRQLAIRKKMLKIVNARLMRMPARKRPRFTAYERYELLEIKSARPTAGAASGSFVTLTYGRRVKQKHNLVCRLSRSDYEAIRRRSCRLVSAFWEKADCWIARSDGFSPCCLNDRPYS